MSEHITPDEADDAMMKLGPDDIAYLVADHAKRTDVPQVWRDALARAVDREGGIGAKKSKNHRRGRRG
jgi:hypothetical protein